MAVPKTTHYRKSLDHGDTLPCRPHLHWIGQPKLDWVRDQKGMGKKIVIVELDEGAIPLSMLNATDRSTVLLLGNETNGIPDDALDLADEMVQIPMLGVGKSLNVAVAGSLVAYRLAGLS